MRGNITYVTPLLIANARGLAAASLPLPINDRHFNSNSDTAPDNGPITAHVISNGSNSS